MFALAPELHFTDLFFLSLKYLSLVFIIFIHVYTFNQLSNSFAISNLG